jgi:phage/plasmid-associated DNA primase
MQADCVKYWIHVKENICNNNEEAYQYVRKWLACVFQRPDEVHTALVLCGSQGVGKNSFVEPLGVLLGTHYAPLSSISELVSNFNYHLKNAVLIHANEALWGGNKKEIGSVKAMITEQTCLIEGKGKDRIVVRNFKHVILSSNEDWPVHLDPDDRRFFVLSISDAHKEDYPFFKSIHTELQNGGYEGLLYDLLNEDLTNFDPRKMPESFSSFSIKIRSAESVHRYIYEALSQGELYLSNNENKGFFKQLPIPKDSIYQDYAGWCQQSGEKNLSKELFGRIIKKVLVSIEDKRPAGEDRKRCYVLPSLRQAQKDFCKLFKENPKNIFDNFENDQEESSL